MKRDDIYYKAMLARDHRFDGKFFVGVKTTGIYCRPVCPAKPKRENVEFFAHALEAERAGYRPCLRCRPESAPRSPAWIGKSAVVQRVLKVLHDQETLEKDEDRFASRFGVTARHLRRLFTEEIGKTPKQIALENRLNLARKLIVETELSLADAAFAAGFNSVRRFNDSFKERFKKSPGEIRRSPLARSSGLQLSLPYRPPLNFAALVSSYEAHRVGDLESFGAAANGKFQMGRIIEFDGVVGRIEITDDPERSRLLVGIDFADTTKIAAIIARVRALFDLDSDPVIVANAIETDPQLRPLWRKHAGLRLPSGWDPFEVAIGTILGQLVSLDRARALVAQLIDLLGKDSGFVQDGKSIRLFPKPEVIAAADLGALKTTAARRRTLIAFATAVAAGTLSLEPTQDVEEFKKRVLDLPGIGPWTAEYMALKCLRHTDAFPETDLILARALERLAPKGLALLRPWRGYVAVLLWREYAGTLKKEKGVSRDKNPMAF